MVKLLYFAWVRERIGIESEKLDLPADVTTPMALITWLKERSGGYGEVFAAPEKLRCAVDQVMTPLDVPFASPQEIAFFPPVTGG